MNENLRLLRPFFRGLPIIIFVVFIAVIGAKKYLTYVTPMYESTAKLKLADAQEGVPSANLFKDFDIFASANKIATEIEVLKSTELIEKTINELPFHTEIYRKGEVRTVELFEDSPFNVESTFNSDELYDKKIGISIHSKNSFTLFVPNQKKIKSEFGKPIVLKNGQVLITLNDSLIAAKQDLKIVDEYEIEFLSNQKILAKIDKGLDIVAVDKDVPVIRINLKSNVPQKAALFVNKLAEMYIRDYIENKFKAANITVDFLKKEIEGANEKLVASEDNIQTYRDTKNIINIKQETETDLRKISQQKIQQTNIKMSLDAIKDLNKYIASGKDKYLDLATNFEAFTDLLSTEMIKSIKKLQADKKDLLLTYTPENEKVKIIDDKLYDLISYQIESIKNTEKNLQIKYNELTRDIEESELVFLGLPEKERIMTVLDREFNMYEKNYNFLNEKRIEAEIAKSAKLAFHKIITAAEVSKAPVSPVRIIIIIVAAFLGLFGSTMLIYIVHFAKAKVNDAHTIEQNSTIPIAIATPFLKNESDIEINFLNQAMQLELKEMLNKKNLITITSYNKSNEHIFHSQNLINAFQKQGRNVLLVDATGDFQNSFQNSNYINFSDISFLNYTRADFELEIQKKLENYDLCVVHNQAIKEDKLALMFMSIANQNLFVVDSRNTAEKSIIQIELIKDEYKLPNVWFVLNRNKYSPSVFVEIKKLWKKFSKKQA